MKSILNLKTISIIVVAFLGTFLIWSYVCYLNEFMYTASSWHYMTLFERAITWGLPAIASFTLTICCFAIWDRLGSKKV